MVITSASVPERSTDESLPVSEFFHPVPLCAIVMMAVNDHLLKGSGLLPGAVTGKLSNICGMIFFPVFMTALVDTGLFGLDRLLRLIGRPYSVPYRLSHRKLLVAVIATGMGFAGLQLFPEVVRLYAAFHHLFGIAVAVTRDITDLLALPFLLVAYVVGRKSLEGQCHA